MRAKDIMTKDVITIGEEARVNDAIKKLSTCRINCLPVVDQEGKLEGIVTETDFIYVDKKVNPTSHYAYEESYIAISSSMVIEHLSKLPSLHIKDIMTRDVISIEEDASIENIIDIIVNKNIKTIPVVRDEKVVGIVGRKDVLMYYLEVQE